MILLIEILLIMILAMIMITLIVDERMHLKRMSHMVKLRSYWDGINRRSVMRHNVTLDVAYKLQNNVKVTRCRDISTHGIGLVLDEKLERRSILNLEIKVDAAKDPIKTKAKVMWCKEAFEDEKSGEKRQFHTGFKFLRFQDPRHEKVLFDYIRTIEAGAGNGYANL